MFATAKLEAWCLLTNARLSASEIDAIRDHAKPRVVAFTVDASKDAASHAERLNAASTADAWRFIVDESVAPEPVESDPACQCAALIYTTGTTGPPKAVILAHRNLLFTPPFSNTAPLVIPHPHL